MRREARRAKTGPLEPGSGATSRAGLSAALVGEGDGGPDEHHQDDPAAGPAAVGDVQGHAGGIVGEQALRLPGKDAGRSVIILTGEGK